MSWESWFTLAVICLAIILLAREFTVPGAIVLGSVVVLLVAGVIDAGAAFAGFGNPAPITVAALYVIAAGVQRTGILNRLVDFALRGEKSDRALLSRLAWPVGAASAVLNNTPIVAMLVPPVSRWAQRAGRSVSPFLMPLSYAAMLGGMLTIIGTSTNIVMSGLLAGSGYEPLGFFEVAKLGLPIAIVGLVLIPLLAPLVLPERRSARRDLEDSREFVVEMWVDDGGSLDGVGVAAAGLRQLAGVFLAHLERRGEPIVPVSPDLILRGGDRLRFVGHARNIADLQATAGLTHVAREHAAGIPAAKAAFFEAVIGGSSPLAGTTLKAIGFRSRYAAAVVAVHRADHRVEGKLGEVRLRVGDTLLLLASPAFYDRWRDSSDFLLVSRFDDVEPTRSNKTLVASLIGVSVVVLAASGALPILEAALLGAFATVAAGVLSPSEAVRAVDLDVIVVIAASFGLGAALTETGLAQRLADLTVGALEPLGGVAVLLGVALATTLLTEAITNNAAAVLVFPMAIATAESVGADPHAYAVTVALMASASFLTPVGYQTNTMVWGPGGYRFGDYARLGVPLTLVTMAAVVFVAPAWWVV